MNDWDLIENMLLGADDLETEELERSIDMDAPMIKAMFRDDKSMSEIILDALKFLPVMVGMMLICPFWLLYEEYLLPVWWKVSDWWELIQWEHEHLPVEQSRPLTAKQKKECIVTGIVCGILLLTIIYLSYLMSKY